MLLTYYSFVADQGNTIYKILINLIKLIFSNNNDITFLFYAIK